MLLLFCRAGRPGNGFRSMEMRWIVALVFVVMGMSIALVLVVLTMRDSDVAHRGTANAAQRPLGAADRFFTLQGIRNGLMTALLIAAVFALMKYAGR